MTLVLNGRPHEAPEGTTVERLLADLDLARSPVAVELNREVVPKVRHGATALREGDRIEIVTLVGGG
jgi:sulfur carrier protein